ncbi:MAG: PQQ-dependent sugar dehydrogenase [Verrucomicrobiota bacterium]
MTAKILLTLLTAATLHAREPWTTSRIQGAPENAKPFVSEEIWKQYEVDDVLEIVGLPGRALMVERRGEVWCLPRDFKSTEKRHLVVAMKTIHPDLDHLYGMAFHPNWQTNREVYVTYTTGQKIEDGTKLSRFKLSSVNPPTIDPYSERVLLTWLSGGHNGAHVQFGPDGMLYVSMGDAESPAPPDQLSTGQDNRDFLSSILRIDVDKRDKGKNYAVPPDNPFIGKKDARPEIWAFGFRNPWKMSFDDTGRLWCGDVGWEMWEMIHLVGRGTNHGWSAMEASQPIRPERLSPLAPITPPVVAHPHTEAASITGGYVYHGKAYSELDGAYIYGDYETGKIWALWHDGTKITRHEEIADTPHKISTFGRLDDGEIVYAHWGRPGSVHHLVRNPAVNKPSSFPRKLSDTGLFADVKKQTPSVGIHEFTVSEPMWQDRLVGRRFIGLPGESKVEASVKKKPDGTVESSAVVWPKDAVLAKTLSTPGAEARLVETQVLHFDGETWNGYSYRWNEGQTDAELVTANGAEQEIAISGGAPLQHRFHARAECIRCHTPWTGFSLGFQPQQLSGIDGEASAREMAIKLGLVNEAFFEMSTARLVASHDDKADLEMRARSWLHANCAHCHRLNGGGSVALKVNMELSLLETEMIGEKPLRGDLGIEEARIMAPGAPWRSVLLARIGRTGSGRMPVIGSHEVDEHAFELLWKWVEDLGKRTPAVVEKVPATPAAKAVDEKLAVGVGFSKAMKTVPEVLAALHNHSKTGAVPEPEVCLSPDSNIAGLLERFLPPEKRRKTIGLAPDLPQLLGLKGDAKRGAALISPSGVLASCLACHFVNGTGRDFGPDLSKVGSRMNRQQLLESLVHPSKVVAKGFEAQVAELADGTLQMGFLLRKTKAETVLKLATGQSLAVPAKELKSLKQLPASLMPEGLLQSLTSSEVADLLSFLSSLK